MEDHFKKASGISLLLGATFATITMAVHPMGGTLAEIASREKNFIFSHGLAIMGIPLIAFGLWGLATALATKNKISFLAFTIVLVGLIAVMMAGVLNGFVLPMFASAYSGSTVDVNVLQAIRAYGWFIGASMDYIFIAAFSLAMITWSFIIINTGQLSKWLGFYGLLIVIVTGTGLIVRFNYSSAHGFGLYIFSLMSWIFIAAILLIRSAK